MATSPSKKPRNLYYILLDDKQVYARTSESLLEKKRETSEISKGTLVSRSTRKQSSSNGGSRWTVLSLDDDFEFDCFSSDVSPVNNDEKDLLLAVSSRTERHHIYRAEKSLLKYGVTSRTGEWVFVKWKVNGTLQDVAGVIRYKGELPTQSGIYFGVELEEYRGSGTTDGTFRLQRFFQCEQDCGVFVPINKIKQRFSRLEKRHQEKRHHVKPLDAAVELAIDPEKLTKGQRVCVFTEEGKKEGEVLYTGKPRGSQIELVGILLDQPVKRGEHSEGWYHSERLFYTKDPPRTILVPKDSVIPTGELIRDTGDVMRGTGDLIRDTVAVEVLDIVEGEWVTNDTREGTEDGAGPCVGIQEVKEDQCPEVFSDGTYHGQRLFYPREPQKTVLVPARRVRRSLSSVEACNVEALDHVEGDWVTIDTSEGTEDGVVVWSEMPEEGEEHLVGVQMMKDQRTVLVPLKFVRRSLSSDPRNPGGPSSRDRQLPAQHLHGTCHSSERAAPQEGQRPSQEARRPPAAGVVAAGSLHPEQGRGQAEAVLGAPSLQPAAGR